MIRLRFITLLILSFSSSNFCWAVPTTVVDSSVSPSKAQTIPDKTLIIPKFIKPDGRSIFDKHIKIFPVYKPGYKDEVLPRDKKEILGFPTLIDKK